MVFLALPGAMSKFTLLFTFCVSFLYNGIYVQAQDGASCKTPKDQPGKCMSVYNCKILLDIVNNPSGLTPEVIDYLKRHSCGVNGGTPYVCCPQETTRELQLVDPVVDNSFDSYRFLKSPQCGRSNASFPRVVGGNPAHLGEFPWIVALGYQNTKNPSQPRWLCGGSLITYKHVLTAAHCVANRKDLYLARVGELDLYDDADGARPTDIPLVKAKIHENYSAQKFINDIAILTLGRSTEGFDSVWPICLPWQTNIRTINLLTKSAFVAGWGNLYFNGPSSSILQYVQIPIMDNSQCARAYGNQTTIDGTILCAGFPNGLKDACKGDSGGPFMHGIIENRNNQRLINFYQVGVVSYGFRCAEAGYPGVYTRVTSFLDWIGKNIAD
ncbi:venom protease-like [Euwallacea similis]|uniref:venom protease-like n=1 Tax=Euwallacea similis TaxID=1736056 RepID=UPI00345021F0